MSNGSSGSSTFSWSSFSCPHLWFVHVVVLSLIWFDLDFIDLVLIYFDFVLYASLIFFPCVFVFSGISSLVILRSHVLSYSVKLMKS